MATHLGWFYLALRTKCLLEVERGERPTTVEAGDLIIVSPGRGHSLQDKADRPTAPIQDLLKPEHFDRREPLVHGGGGAPAHLFCGCFLLEGLQQSPLHAALPTVIRVAGRAGAPQPYVDHIVRLIELEAAEDDPGGQSIINRLVRILYLKALQGHLAALPADSAGWLRALADPDIGRALELMHARPDVPWTVAALAAHVAMARSTFAARFTELVGQPPLEYLTHWRIRKACALLRTTRAELKEVAAQVGYESHSAFSKAFARWAGTAPGAYRRAGAATAHAPQICLPPM